MFRPTTKIIYKFTYMCRAYFNDGREPLVLELFTDSEVGLEGFKKNVKGWNQTGQLMKEIPSKSHVQGYDYWTTPEQDLSNSEVTYERKNELVYVHDQD